jgi:hypothetical protein
LKTTGKDPDLVIGSVEIYHALIYSRGVGLENEKRDKIIRQNFSTNLVSKVVMS